MITFVLHLISWYCCDIFNCTFICHCRLLTYDVADISEIKSLRLWPYSDCYYIHLWRCVSSSFVFACLCRIWRTALIMACTARQLAEKLVNFWMKNVHSRTIHWLGQSGILRLAAVMAWHPMWYLCLYGIPMIILCWHRYSLEKYKFGCLLKMVFLLFRTT